MKIKKLNYIVSALIALSMQFIYAQNDSQDIQLPGTKKAITGGYFGFGSGFTEVERNNGIILSLKGAWIAKYKHGMGVFVKAFLSSSEPNPHLGNTYQYSFSTEGAYGGAYYEYRMGRNEKYSCNLIMHVGIGTVNYVGEYYKIVGDEYYIESYIVDSNGFAIAEPGIEFEIKLMKYFRASAFFTYKFTTNKVMYSSSIETDEQIILTHKDTIDNFTLGILFKIGKFK